MVRLEKIFYEKIINNSLIGRNRIINKPSKIVYGGDNKINFRSLLTPFLKPFLKPFKPFYDKFVSTDKRSAFEEMRDMGFSWIDFSVYTDQQLRRDTLYEHIWRESFHPMERELYLLRRKRYFKIFYSVDGCEVPNYLQKEADDELFVNKIENVLTIDNVFKNQYFQEMNSMPYIFLGKYIVFEFLIFINLFKYETWNRLFYNEVNYMDYDNCINGEDQDSSEFLDKNLINNRELFEEEINRLDRLYPNLFSSRTQELDMEKIWNKYKEYHSVKYNSENFSSVLKREIDDKLNYKQNNIYIKKGENKFGTNNVGKELPKRIFKNKEKALMS